MVVERGRTSSLTSPYVTKRLCITMVFSVGILCIVGGFLLGNMARNQVKRSSDIVPFNLTTHAENLYKKARRILPKVIHSYDPEKITAKLLEIFHCSHMECGAINEYQLSDFVKNCIITQVTKLMKSITSAALYLDSLR